MNENQLKKLLTLVGIIVLIAVGITAINSLQNKSSDKVLLAENVKSSIDRIQIDNTNGSLALAKKDGNWQIETFDADQDKINNFLDLLVKAKIVNVASTNESNYSLFSVDDQNGIGMALYQDQSKALTLIVGKSTTSGNYIRISGDSNVYLIDQDINSTVAGDLNSFKDKTLSRGGVDDLNTIIAKDFQLNKTANGYELSSGEQLDQSKTLTFVNNMINLNGYDIATDDEAKGIVDKQSDLNFEIDFKNGANYKFEFYKIDEDNYLAKRDKDGTILKIYKSQFDNANIGVDGLK